MLHGYRVSGQEFDADRNRSRGGNKAADCSHQLISRQDGCTSGSTRRKDVEELEESSLRKAKGPRRRTINQTKQAMACRFSDRNRMQTKQAFDFEGRRLPLTGGYHLWRR